MVDPSEDVASIRTWVRTHKVVWEFQPLMESVKGVGLRRTGLELHLFAECSASADVETKGLADLHDGVRRIAERALSRDAGVLVEMMPFEAAEHLRPETGYEPEIQVTVCLTPADPNAAETQIEAAPGFLEGLQATIEGRLRDLGLQPRAWGATRS
jgi:hypothetical protein